ncbi:hypothetical protein Q7554_12215 [Glaesserella parasuis]|nr:hypothetical protein [Glaesserella parasuis]
MHAPPATGIVAPLGKMPIKVYSLAKGLGIICFANKTPPAEYAITT